MGNTVTYTYVQTPLAYTRTVCNSILDFCWYIWKERSKEEWLLFTLTLLHNYSSAVVHLERAELLISNVFTLANVFRTRTDFIFTCSWQLRNSIDSPNCQSASAALYVLQNGPVEIQCVIPLLSKRTYNVVLVQSNLGFWLSALDILLALTSQYLFAFQWGW